MMVGGMERWTHLRATCESMWTGVRSGGRTEHADKGSGKDDASFMLCEL